MDEENSENRTARQRAHMPAGTQAVLNTRTLTASHRRLAELIAPGQAVLDVGCGTGAITRGIAEGVAPDGHAVGLDIHAGLIDEARRLHANIPGLSFEIADLNSGLPQKHQNAYDIVTAARTLQWLADPAGAVAHLAAGAQPGGGKVLVLDYAHERITWEPEPPEPVRHFYTAFLAWRTDAGMDNSLADHLPAMLARAGLTNITVTAQHETTLRGDSDFAERADLWAKVAEVRGPQIVRDGYLTEADRLTAIEALRYWAVDSAVSQTLYLLAVEGTRK